MRARRYPACLLCESYLCLYGAYLPGVERATSVPLDSLIIAANLQLHECGESFLEIKFFFVTSNSFWAGVYEFCNLTIGERSLT